MKASTPTIFFGLLFTVIILGIFSSSVQAVTIPTSGLQLYYKFDEGSGSIASDSSGNGHTGTLGSDVTWVTGKVNDGVQFDGNTNSYVDAGVLSAGSSDWSVALWFTGNNVGGDWHDVYAQGDYGLDGHFEVAIDVSGSKCGSVGVLALVAWSLSPDAICSTSGNLNDNQFHNVAVTYDHTYVSFYVDGVLSNQVAISGDIGSTTLHTCIGDRDTGSGSCISGGYPWIGKGDEVLVYNRALSSGEAQQIYSYGVQATTSISTTTTTTTSLSTTTSIHSTTSTTTSTSVHSTTNIITTSTSLTTTSPSPLTIDTNSTLLSYLVSGNGINITVSGPSGTVGHMKVVLSKTLINGNPIVYLDNGQASFIPPTTITSNSTDWIFQLYYHQSQNQISIQPIVPVPEYPVGIAPLLALSLILTLAFLRRKRGV